MLSLTDGLILYHGSYCEVMAPQLSKCAGRKDFGKGFYLTSSREQAIGFLKTAIAKAVTAGDIPDGQNFGYVSEFTVELNKELQVKTFEDADVEWLHCVAGHRRSKSFSDMEKEMADYDVIIGKIADDQTNTTLVAYIAGAYGEVGSKEADAFCISRLMLEKLKDQFCFRTDDAIECLRFQEAEKIWLNR